MYEQGVVNRRKLPNHLSTLLSLSVLSRAVITSELFGITVPVLSPQLTHQKTPLSNPQYL